MESMMTRAITSYATDSEFVARLQAKLAFHKIETEIRISNFGGKVEVYGAAKDAARISALTIMALSK